LFHLVVGDAVGSFNFYFLFNAARSSTACIFNMPSALSKKLISTLGKPAGIEGILSDQTLPIFGFFYQVAFALVNGNSYSSGRQAMSCTAFRLLSALLSFGNDHIIQSAIVSMPRESGVTSSSKISLRFPAKMSACIAAPRATTSSGSARVHGAAQKFSNHFVNQCGSVSHPP